MDNALERVVNSSTHYNRGKLKSKKKKNQQQRWLFPPRQRTGPGAAFQGPAREAPDWWVALGHYDSFTLAVIPPLHFDGLQS